MDTQLVRAAGDAYAKLMALGVFALTAEQLEAKGFTLKRYRNEGPSKHEQEEIGSPCIVLMYDEWARELMESIGLEPDEDLERRLVCEHVYDQLGHGLFKPRDEDWTDVCFNTVPLKVAAGAREAAELGEKVCAALKTAGLLEGSSNFKVTFSVEPR